MDPTIIDDALFSKSPNMADANNNGSINGNNENKSIIDDSRSRLEQDSDGINSANDSAIDEDTSNQDDIPEIELIIRVCFIIFSGLIFSNQFLLPYAEFNKIIPFLFVVFILSS